ncbi:type VII secretion-associated serine protease mycosin [Streptomyces sp. NBC_00566]|uniref:type VII secretion-associated serine protease mycosin n=1 Tax=Streptomyces sp. NBC_00566 TaxID=2975778 RepID=UPI002E81E29D|nr:type VII secretion-associated serine protease mycosin [Streptomyces sp. NBC_00566]WUB86461.1 type VII secretion-associated serine protease mycosin [Streptomyces sp. NBC_00566]
MRTRGMQRYRVISMASAALGLLLVGLSAGPAQAESIRAQQWYLDAMHAPEVWKSSTGHGVTVALIDSGVDGSLADLKGQVLDGKDFSTLRGNEHTDVAGHGTSMAAIIAATGARGGLSASYGLAPGAKILPIRMLDSQEVSGRMDANTEYSEKLTQAIRYAADSKAQIINMSLALSDSRGRHDVGTPELAAAVKYALSKGKLLFAGVGNRGDKENLPSYPASTPGVVGVGAADQKARLAAFSQRGPSVDMVAPGVDMVHACTGGSQLCKSKGTSDATAIASATAALIWSKHPDWTNNQVLRVMLNTLNKPANDSKRNDFIGYGGIRLRAAMDNPGDPGPADEYPLPDLAAAAAKSPSPKSPKPTAPAKHEEAAPKSNDDGNSLLWAGAGVAAALLVGAAAAFAVFRSRRRTVTTPPPPPAYPPYVPAPSPHQPPAGSHHRSEQNP